MAKHLSDANIRRLPAPPKGNKITYDDAVPGFGVRVTAAGHQAFVLSYRTRAGRERRITIGSASDWQTAAARVEAKRLRRLIDQGGDPLGDIEIEREAPTVAELINRFVAEHAEPRLRAHTVRHYKMLIGRHIRPHFGAHTKVADVTFADIDGLHRKVTRDGGPYVANRVVGVLSKMFALAIRWVMRDDNPARGIEKNYEVKRKRYLSGDELSRLTIERWRRIRTSKRLTSSASSCSPALAAARQWRPDGPTLISVPASGRSPARPRSRRPTMWRRCRRRPDSCCRRSTADRSGCSRARRVLPATSLSLPRHGVPSARAPVSPACAFMICGTVLRVSLHLAVPACR
jgi:Arm DNA-binding domain/Phage integrase, N-terminal SAM-like domain